MGERERIQLVLALGEGAEGQRLREVLDQAASRAGKVVSAWAKEILFEAAGASKAEAPVDPLVAEIRYRDGHDIKVMDFDLRAVVAMQGGSPTDVRALVPGVGWVVLLPPKPDELMERWRRVRRWV